MTLLRYVAELVRLRGSGTVDDFLPELAELGYSRIQVGKALHNATLMGLVYCNGRKPRRGTPRGQSCAATYYPAGQGITTITGVLVKKEPAPLVASVWDMANPKTTWPQPPAVRTIHTPLGSWNSEEAA
jgi:hypothetical protein